MVLLNSFFDLKFHILDLQIVFFKGVLEFLFEILKVSGVFKVELFSVLGVVGLEVLDLCLVVVLEFLEFVVLLVF